MQTYARSRAAFIQSIDDAKAALDARRDAVLKEADACHKPLMKAYDTKMDEYMVTSSQLSVVASLCAAAAKLSGSDLLRGCAAALASVKLASTTAATPPDTDGLSVENDVLSPLEILFSVDCVVDAIGHMATVRKVTLLRALCGVGKARENDCSHAVCACFLLQSWDEPAQLKPGTMTALKAAMVRDVPSFRCRADFG